MESQDSCWRVFLACGFLWLSLLSLVVLCTVPSCVLACEEGTGKMKAQPLTQQGSPLLLWTGSHCTAQTGLMFVIPLPWSPGMTFTRVGFSILDMSILQKHTCEV